MPKTYQPPDPGNVSAHPLRPMCGIRSVQVDTYSHPTSSLTTCRVVCVRETHFLLPVEYISSVIFSEQTLRNPLQPRVPRSQLRYRDPYTRMVTEEYYQLFDSNSGGFDIPFALPRFRSHPLHAKFYSFDRYLKRTTNFRHFV